MQENLPPRLIAIADAPLWRERAGRAPLAFAVGRLAAACRGRPWRTGLLLRQHNWSAAQWLDALQEFQWFGEFGMALGISAPRDGAGLEQRALLAGQGVSWVQVPEGQAAAWHLAGAGDFVEAAPPLAWARSCHDLAGVAAALAAGAPWATLSPVLPTPSKPAAAPLGWSVLTEACSLYPKRIVALGGMDALAASQALRCGAAGVAVLGAWQEQPRALADALSAADAGGAGT